MSLLYGEVCIETLRMVLLYRILSLIYVGVCIEKNLESICHSSIEECVLKLVKGQGSVFSVTSLRGSVY